jgi:hypothetical protein
LECSFVKYSHGPLGVKKESLRGSNLRQVQNMTRDMTIGILFSTCAHSTHALPSLPCALSHLFMGTAIAFTNYHPSLLFPKPTNQSTCAPPCICNSIFAWIEAWQSQLYGEDEFILYMVHCG